MCSKVTLGHRFDNNFWMVKNFWMRPMCIKKYTFGAWIWAQILYFFSGNQESYSRLNMSYRVTRNINSNYVVMEGRKNGSLMIRSWIWLKNIFPTSHDQSSRIKILCKNTIMASYSRAIIAKKMCWKVTFGHRFDNNFLTVRNFWVRPECLRKYTFRAWIWIEILYFFDGNQGSYSPLNTSYRVTWNTDSNHVPMEGRKNGSLMIRSRIWLGNIFPISRD